MLQNVLAVTWQRALPQLDQNRQRRQLYRARYFPSCVRIQWKTSAFRSSVAILPQEWLQHRPCLCPRQHHERRIRPLHQGLSDGRIRCVLQALTLLQGN